MEIMYLLVPVSVVLVFLIGGAFWWSLRNGQYDDMQGPGYRILMDKDKPVDNPVEGRDQAQAAGKKGEMDSSG